MKKLVVLLAVAAAFEFCSNCHANITSALWYSDGDGVIVCPAPGWTNNTPGPVSSLWMSGNQYAVSTPDHGTPGPATGHMIGQVLTDSESDPTLNLSGSIQNSTGGAWLGYTINVIMSVPFSFTAPSPTVDNVPYSTWIVAGVGAPTLQPSGPWAGYYLGDLVFSYTGADPIPIGDTMDYSYSINFSGSGLMFSFTQEMIPAFSPIPEPSAFVLVGMGGLMLALCRRNRRPAA